ncbi:MAG: metalloregulator ArsR/SmtB family transcription factor [Candidatus Auribacterota bacterium]|jgi:ArsR family transcriptional regulator|uniref:ArsR family transcriptional regulator n=1 Tax=Candidatus Auribacter fodinae TaxID=2093366 RepID=A0A3A4R978_9BACT|nr:MAG: ArsR family transcriptional regulator [Candidatus Auribacter fodinae]
MKKMISVFKALSDRNRLRVVAALDAHNELCACQITELLKVTGATASRHMSVLVSAGLVESRKDGRWVHYRLSDNDAPLGSVLEWIRAEYSSDPQILKDRNALAQITACDPEELCRKQRGEECCP